MSKPRIIKDFEKLSPEILEQIKMFYPYGFEKKLISFTNAQGKLVSALPFETDEYYYLIRMTRSEAQEIIEEDTDYDSEGNLKEDFIEEVNDKQEQELEADSDD